MRLKRVISAALAVSMAVSMVPATAVTAFADEVGNTIVAGTTEEGENEKQAVTVEVELDGTKTLQEAVQEKISNTAITLADITELKVTTTGTAALTKDDFAFMSGTKVTGSASDRYAYSRPEDLVYLTSLEVVDLSNAVCKDESYAGNMIPGRAFFGNKTITKIILPNTLERIGLAAFCGMTELTYLGTDSNLHFPSTLEVMGESMISGDTKLSGDLHLPANLKAIGASCFANSGIQGDIEIDGNIEIESNIDYASAVSTSVSEAEYIFAGSNENSGSKITSLKFGQGVEVITKGFAAECPELKSVEFSDTVREIHTMAFFRDTKLSGTLVIPKNVTKIGVSAFSRDMELEHIIVENPEIELGYAAFANHKDGLKLYFASSKAATTNNVWNMGEIIGNNKAIVLNTDGGKIDTSKGIDETTGLYTPEKDGYTFSGWYTDITDENTKLNGEAQPGNTYTAKWTQNENTVVLSTNAEYQAYTVGEETEFNVTTNVNGTDVMVFGTFELADDTKDAVQNVQYYETWNNEWTDLQEGPFGPANTGFRVTDGATSQFKVKFKKAGTYSFTVAIKKVENGEPSKNPEDVLATKTITVTVNPRTQTVELPENVTVKENGKDVTYKVVNNQLVANVSDIENGTEIAVTVKNPKYGDTYKWSVNDVEASETSKTYSFKVTNADVKVGLEITAHEYVIDDFKVSGLGEYTYGDDINVKVEPVDESITGYTVQYVKNAGDADETVSDILPKDVGTYNVRIIKDGKTIDVDETFTIKPATPAKSDFTVTLPDNVVADGEEHTAKLEVKDNSLFKSDKVEVKTSYLMEGEAEAWDEVTAPVKAGKYQLVAEIISSDPNLSSGKLYWDFTLNEKEIEPQLLTIKNAEFTVNGETVAADKDGDVLTAKVPVGAEVTVSYTSQSDAVVFDQWTVTTDAKLDVDVKSNPLTFKMPADGVTIEAMTKDASIEDEPNVLGTAAVIGTAAVGTAVLAWQGYQLGTELYLKAALPAGAAIPTNRAELALLVWNNAGKPEPVAVLPTDATETEKAIAWAVENDLLKAAKDNGEAYEDTDSVSKLEVIQVWNKATTN